MCHLRVFLFNSLWIAGGMSSVFLFDFFALGRLLVMHGQTILLLRKIAPFHWVFVLSFVCVLLLDDVSAPTKSCECGLNATWVYHTWPMYFVSVVFTPYPISHHGCVWFLLVISLHITIIVGAGLPNHMIGEVSWDPKRRQS